MSAAPVLIAYDGSPAARRAIEVAGHLLGPGPATVLSAWSPVLTAAPVMGGAPAYLSDLNPGLGDAARESAEEGARLAREAGFRAESTTARGTAPWASITGTAEAIDARVIVVGARGLSGLKSALLGSTSNGVVHHCARPVLVVHEQRGSP